MSTKRITTTDRDEARERLRTILQPGDTVYTTLKHVSRSGMSRLIGVHAIQDNEPCWLSYLVHTATGLSFNDKREALRADGCGMDMGFHVAYTLSRVLYPDGFGCIGERCPSNDHSNGDRDHTAGDTHWHKDGGYALRHRWLS
jgi:hypothetical protein